MSSVRQLVWRFPKAVNRAICSSVIFSLSCPISLRASALLVSLFLVLCRNVSVKQNAAAGLMSVARRPGRVSTILHGLHWLPIRRRVTFKSAVSLVHTGDCGKAACDAVHTGAFDKAACGLRLCRMRLCRRRLCGRGCNRVSTASLRHIHESSASQWRMSVVAYDCGLRQLAAFYFLEYCNRPIATNKLVHWVL